MRKGDNGVETIPTLPVPGTASTEKALSSPLLPDSVGAISGSTSLIDESASRLFGALGSMRINDRDDIESAVKLAKEIRELGKLKLDIAKFSLEARPGAKRFGRGE
jgi:hypothetical protein